MPIESWWRQVNDATLARGDYLPKCLVPSFQPDYGVNNRVEDVQVGEYDCIILTQSCDLVNDKAPLVALGPIYSIAEFERVNPKFRGGGIWENVRQGRVERLHLFASHASPDQNRNCLVANFREIFSLPVGYLKGHAIALGWRLRLQSPYLEHFSQSFARFFMRVGLPSTIPAFSR